MSLPEFQVLRPRTLEEALELLDRRRGAIQVIAGGTDLVPSLKQKLFAPRYLLDLKSLGELRYIRNGAGLEIGALTTVSEVAGSAEVRRHFPVLAEAAHVIASPVLRTMGTLGGNLCLDTRCLWYNQSQFWRQSCGFCLKKDGTACHVAPGGDRCWAVFSGDTAPALLALGAEIEIVSPRGARRLPLEQFYTGDGMARMKLAGDEILTRIFVPAESSGMRGAYLKFRLRGSIDYPLAGVAVALSISPDGMCLGGRVAVTALNPAPLVVQGSQEALHNARLSDELLETLAQLAGRSIKPLTTSASTPEYRRDIARVFVKRAVRQAWNP
ncbi:MAG: FAD binding domain-containing protein [Acidobacteria bacterium]|nr:FAD binding domain-containing protein [Acidobacteriota bacterium]